MNQANAAMRDDDLWAGSCELFHPGILSPMPARCGSEPARLYIVPLAGRPKRSPAWVPMLLCDGHAEELEADSWDDVFGPPSKPPGGGR